jgi:putative pantetheine hydrolase
MASVSRQLPGPTNSIVDVDGIEVGHVTRDDAPFLTGCTVVLARAGAVGGVDVRGGGPGTRETDVLDPRNLVEQVHAVLLTGGSAYGLAAATGVMSALEDRGIGFRVGAEAHEIVPIVPAAVLYDLGRGGDFRARPDALFGIQAVADASADPPAQGNVGAGTGAVAGALKGGVGSASVALESGAVVGAIVALNAFGSAVSPETGEPYGAFAELADEFGDGARRMTLRAMPRRRKAPDARPPFNTTIGVVATNVRLDKAQAQKLAGGGQTGMARAIRPVHTLFDGDTVFALSTGARELADGSSDPFERATALNELYAAAADTFTRAIVHALLAAETVGEWRAYGDT